VHQFLHDFYTWTESRNKHNDVYRMPPILLLFFTNLTRINRRWGAPMFGRCLLQIRWSLVHSALRIGVRK